MFLFIINVPTKYRGTAEDGDISKWASEESASDRKANNLDHRDNINLQPVSFYGPHQQQEQQQLPPKDNRMNASEGPAAVKYFRFDAAQKILDCLDDYDIRNAIWLPNTDKTRFQVTFPCLLRTDEILESLLQTGLGRKYGSISVVPIDVARPNLQYFDPVESDEDVPEAMNESDHTSNGSSSREKFKTPTDRVRSAAFMRKTQKTKKEVLLEAVKSKLALERVLDETRLGAQWSFDFISMVIVAAFIAGIGLILNNPVVTVASMLISPLIRPILGWSFGTIIHDWDLVHVASISETLGLLLTIFIGFVMGLIGSVWGVDLGWPNEEMSSRGSWLGLLSGVLIAVPSGAAVALSVLGQNTSSIAGVAISAALLPPAVNCGISIAYALVGPAIHGSDVVNASELLLIGGFSFLLTLVNIALIYVVAWATFKFKEVSPLAGETDFWKKDVQNTRAYNDVADASPLDGSPRRRRRKRPLLAIPALPSISLPFLSGGHEVPEGTPQADDTSNDCLPSSGPVNMEAQLEKAVMTLNRNDRLQDEVKKAIAEDLLDRRASSYTPRRPSGIHFDANLAEGISMESHGPGGHRLSVSSSQTYAPRHMGIRRRGKLSQDRRGSRPRKAVLFETNHTFHADDEEIAEAEDLLAKLIKSAPDEMKGPIDVADDSSSKPTNFISRLQNLFVQPLTRSSLPRRQDHLTSVIPMVHVSSNEGETTTTANSINPSNKKPTDQV